MIVDVEKQLDASLDAHLILWHSWAHNERMGQGYPSEAAGMKMYRTSRQYDYENGAIDGDVDSTIAAAVEAAVSEISDPHRTSLCIEARNLATGVRVWVSARLPMCPVERSVIRMEARNQLLRKLQARGLL